MMDTSDWPNAPYNVGVQRLRGKAELGRGDAIIVHQLIQAAILLVRAHVLQAVQVRHLVQYDRRPLGKILHIVGLQRVLVHRIAGAAADTQILHGLKKRGGHRQTVQLWPKAVDDLRGTDLALRQRLECNINKPVLVAPPPPVNAITFATAGSFLITAPICRMELSIAGNG